MSSTESMLLIAGSGYWLVSLYYSTSGEPKKNEACKITDFYVIGPIIHVSHAPRGRAFQYRYTILSCVPAVTRVRVRALGHAAAEVVLVLSDVS